jgi:hypothetical protein
MGIFRKKSHSYLSKLIVIIHQTQSCENKGFASLEGLFVTRFCALPTIFSVLPVNLTTCVFLEQNGDIIIKLFYVPFTSRIHKRAKGL